MYLEWDEKRVTDEDDISSLYEQGFVFVRPEKGLMKQTRSVRVNMENFALTSENRRILRKTEELEYSAVPLPDPTYHWSVGKMAKDFYEKKFGKGTFSANKVKDLFTNEEKSNFNLQLVYRLGGEIVGYAVCYENKDLIHYSYPFYQLEAAETCKNLGMGMMVRAAQYAFDAKKKYLYLGSAQRPGDTYKFQFRNMQWFDGKVWKEDVEELKMILNEAR